MQIFSRRIFVANLSLSSLLPLLKKQIADLESEEILSLEAADPDRNPGAYAGEKSTAKDGRKLLHRSWRSWNDLATLLGCRLMTPRTLSDETVEIRMQKLKPAGFHRNLPPEGLREKYGTPSPFSRIRKNEEPVCYLSFSDALQRLEIARRKRILDLGINRGDEFAAIREIVGTERFSRMYLTGIDHSSSALESAERRFPEKNVSFLLRDINDFRTLPPERFDLILSVGTLQSPGVETKPLVMRLVQRHLSDDGAVLFGFPNARWIDGELIYGARPLHCSHSDLSLVIKDLHWIKKYLQQHRFRVAVTGREYLWLEAKKLPRSHGQ